MVVTFSETRQLRCGGMRCPDARADVDARACEWTAGVRRVDWGLSSSFVVWDRKKDTGDESLMCRTRPWLHRKSPTPCTTIGIGLGLRPQSRNGALKATALAAGAMTVQLEVVPTVCW